MHEPECIVIQNLYIGIGKNWLLHKGRRPNAAKFNYLQCDFFSSEDKIYLRTLIA